MSREHRPYFKIYRVDRPPAAEDEVPDTHYRAFWKIGEKTYRVHVWSTADWDQRPSEEHPSEAQNIDGRGWMLLKPIESR